MIDLRVIKPAHPFMKTISEQNFDILIKDCFHATLKPLGFKKKGNNFYRQFQDLGQIVNIQKSSFYSKEHISFTINTGLFIPEYWLIFFSYHQGKIPDYPTVADCAINKRIGAMKYNVDKWFDIESRTSIMKLKEEMTDNILNYILPYFEMIKTKADVVRLIEDQDNHLGNFTKLIILGEYNLHDKAQLEYERLKQDKYVFTNMRSAFVDYGEKYKLKD